MNIVVKRMNGSSDEYLLKEKDNIFLKVIHRRDLHTARVETISEQRILIIESEGMIRTRVVIKNEYGVEIGQMTFDNWTTGNRGIVQIEEVRYKFIVSNGPSKELSIYTGNRSKLIYKCNLDFEPGNQIYSKEKTPVYIISIAWYLHLISIKENKPELAM